MASNSDEEEYLNYSETSTFHAIDKYEIIH